MCVWMCGAVPACARSGGAASPRMTEEERDLKAGAVVGRLDGSMVNPLFFARERAGQGTGAGGSGDAADDDRLTANLMELCVARRVGAARACVCSPRVSLNVFFV